MKPTNRLQTILDRGEFGLTGELGPPKGADIAVIDEKAAHLRDVVDAVNITDNQTAIVRMSSVAAGALCVQRGLEPVIQMVCRDRNRIAMQSDIFGAYALGMRNLLCLTGDHQVFGNHPGSKNVYDMDSIQLLGMMDHLCAEGKVQGGDEIEGVPELFLGAASNPFGDPFAFRVRRLAKKVKAGAKFIQTQCIYDMDRFREFMKQVCDLGLDKQTHILAGITPIKSVGMARYMAEKVAGITVPDAVIDRVKAAPKGKKASEGIKIAVEMIQELKEMPGVHGIHLMAIEWEHKVPEIAERAGLLPRPTVEA